MITAETVLVVHPPPRGILDRAFGKVHVGSRRLRGFLLQTRPRLLICGHVHEDSGAASIGRTLVVNCALSRDCGGALIEVAPGTAAKVEIIDRG